MTYIAIGLALFICIGLGWRCGYSMGHWDGYHKGYCQGQYEEQATNFQQKSIVTVNEHQLN